MLSIFWFNSREIDFSACLTQMYFIHCFTVIESGILVAMTLDHYVAICDPLRQSTILTNPVVTKVGLALVLRSGIFVLPHLLLARWWPYCRTNIITHAYYEHMAMVKLVGGDIHISTYYGLFLVFSGTGVDVFFITLSYTQNLRTIFSLLTKDTRHKTCSSHLCVVLAFYVPALFSFLTQWFGHNMPQRFQVLMANVYLLLPLMLNPIIYGTRTKQIQERLLWHFTHKGI